MRLLSAAAVMVVLAAGLAVVCAADAPKPGDVASNSIGMKLAYIPAGEFVMGSASDEKGREDDEAPHCVKITRPFRMGVTEVTQAQWTKVMGQRRGHFEGENLPVEDISWNDAIEFCKKLSKLDGKTYRLPTEAEWEYACRAGALGRFSGAEKLDDLGWYEANSDEHTHPVETKRPNAWGLYDMHGNVAEWCADFYAAAWPGHGVDDPTGPAEGKGRVRRGGSFESLERGCRCASRASTPAAYQLKVVGFRVVMELPQ